MVKFTRREMIVLLQLRKKSLRIEEMVRPSLNQFEVFKALRSLSTRFVTPPYQGIGEAFSLTENGKVIVERLYAQIGIKS